MQKSIHPVEQNHLFAIKMRCRWIIIIILAERMSSQFTWIGWQLVEICSHANCERWSFVASRHSFVYNFIKQSPNYRFINGKKRLNSVWKQNHSKRNKISLRIMPVVVWIFSATAKRAPLHGHSERMYFSSGSASIVVEWLTALSCTCTSVQIKRAVRSFRCKRSH